jgi:hypothetical protein
MRPDSSHPTCPPHATLLGRFCGIEGLKRDSPRLVRSLHRLAARHMAQQPCGRPSQLAARHQGEHPLLLSLNDDACRYGLTDSDSDRRKSC